jgi:membrane protease YdiL (CAAX protease family)
MADRSPTAVIAGFMAIAFAVTWVVVMPLVLAGPGVVDAEPPEWLHAFGALGPTAGAVVLTWRTYGRRGLAELWDRVSNPARIRGVGWLLALSPLLVGVVLVGAAAAVGRLSVGDWAGLWVVVAASVSYGVFEEIGWRGFLLPHLQARTTAIRAAGWVFVIWALWHLPMFAYQLPAGLETIGWLVGLYFGSVWLAVLFNGTRGSVLACILWHSSYNLAVTVGAELSALVPAVVTTLVVVGTIVAVRRVGTAELCRAERVTIGARTPA